MRFVRTLFYALASVFAIGQGRALVTARLTEGVPVNLAPVLPLFLLGTGLGAAAVYELARGIEERLPGSKAASRGRE